MHVYELRVPAASDPRRLAAVRWDLFVFPQVRDVVATSRSGVIGVVYEGERPAAVEWVRTLRTAGYAAEDPAGSAPDPGARPAA